MTGDSDSGEAAFEEAHFRLSEGLKTCRAVLSNYRTLLSETSTNDNEPSGEPGGSAESYNDS